jgi:hypothetical protein
MVLNFIKADKTGDFEAVIGKMKEALRKATNRSGSNGTTGRSSSADPLRTIRCDVFHRPAGEGADYRVDDLERGLSEEVQELISNTLKPRPANF